MNGWKWNKPLTPSVRLPGIAVASLAPPPRMGLPAMDIALFAGFAARGPCNRAIAIDSVANFERVFGGDHLLAEDRTTGQPLHANLPATVRAFFGNGGRRCWVVRIARTAAHEARWTRYSGRAAFADDIAVSGNFILDGLLCTHGGPSSGIPVLRAASMDASSVGSWSDALQVSARVLAAPVQLGNVAAVDFGLSFDDPGGLQAGDLVEIIRNGGRSRLYCKILRTDGARMMALHVAQLQQASIAVAITGTARIPGHEQIFTATATSTGEGCIALDSESHELQIGRWLRFTGSGESLWLQVARIDRNQAFGPLWERVTPTLPITPFQARRITIDISATLAETYALLENRNPGQVRPNSIHALLGDDEIYAESRVPVESFPLSASALERTKVKAASDQVGNAPFAAMAALFGTAAFTSAHYDALCHAWLPIGLGASFDFVAKAVIEPRDPLARDGLSRFDDSLFLDPALATVSARQMAGRIEDVRDRDEEILTGIHAGLDTPDTGFGKPSIFSVPDMAQPGCALDVPSGSPGAPDPGAPDLGHWYDHRGGCAAALPDDPAGARVSPDTSRFLDCSTRLVDAPVLTGPSALSGGMFRLSWSGAPPDAIYVLEEAGDARFTSAAEIYRGPLDHIDLTRISEGSYYYRLHAEVGGEVSAYAALTIPLRTSRFVESAADMSLLQRLHIAVLRMASGTGDMFALLSMPRSWRTRESIAYSNALRTLTETVGGADAFGREEERSLSYGALYHPWVLSGTRRDDGGKPVPLSANVPDGYVAGQMAARALSRGAWIAAANQPFTDMIGLDPLLPDSDQAALYVSRINSIARDPHGFLVRDADTLSNEPEWRQINVRRLMILLRRVALQRGEAYVFEPNGDTMRRAVERDLGQTLGSLQRRGAFAGKSSAQSFRIAADRSVADLEYGRLTFEIGVAPSQPMRFLNVRLVQRGARLSVAEEAA